MKILIAGDTNIGLKRHKNEDSFSIIHLGDHSKGNIETSIDVKKGMFFLVVDGMGGSAGGDLAAKTVIHRTEAFLKDHPDTPPEEVLQGALESANSSCRKIIENNPDLNGMGAVATLCYLQEKTLYIIHIGDTRLYLLRDGILKCITEDQTLVNELFKSGAINQKEAQNHKQRNLVSQAIGPIESLKPFSYQIQLEQGDRILVCSDGLHGFVPEEEITDILDKNSPLFDITQNLIQKANDKGGYDNITTIVLEIVET